MNQKYELSIFDDLLELKYRDRNGKIDSLLVPLADAIPMIFHAATVLSRLNSDAAFGTAEFHGLIRELKRRGAVSN